MHCHFDSETFEQHISRHQHTLSPIFGCISNLKGKLKLAGMRCRGKGDVKCDHSNVASVVFSSPAVAVVGMTEANAVETHKNVEVFSSTFTCALDFISAHVCLCSCALVSHWVSFSCSCSSSRPWPARTALALVAVQAWQCREI